MLQLFQIFIFFFSDSSISKVSKSKVLFFLLFVLFFVFFFLINFFFFCFFLFFLFLNNQIVYLLLKTLLYMMMHVNWFCIFVIGYYFLGCFLHSSSKDLIWHYDTFKILTEIFIKFSLFILYVMSIMPQSVMTAAWISVSKSLFISVSRVNINFVSNFREDLQDLRK